MDDRASQQPTGDRTEMIRRQLETNYEIDPEQIAEALIRRMSSLPEERARYRNALISSLEMLPAGEFDGDSFGV